jgi:hypothetical protein
MGWSTAIQAGTSLLGGWAGSQAADAQGDAAKEQMDWIKSVYGDAQGNFAPYLQAGQGGLNGLSALMGGDYSGFMQSPDFLASQEAGVYANDNSAAAKGRLFSGGYGADLNKWGQDHATQYLGNYRNSLFNLAGMGQNAAGQLGGIGTGTMSAMGQANGAYGDAQANRYGSIFGGLAGLGGAVGSNWGNGSQSSYGGGSQLDWMKGGY